MERHHQAVRLIASTVRSFFERSEPYRIFHGSTNSTRPKQQKAGQRIVDISALNNVLEVNVARRIALVEPNVPMDRLVEHTLRHGLVPPVVMEFPGITAGGGFAGTAGESSSFRHGYFDENVEGVEIVLPDGEVVFARRPIVNTTSSKLKTGQTCEGDGEGKYADLFRGAAGAVGTLGTTTLLELRLIEAKRFVKTTYRRTNTVAEAIKALKEECAREGNDYVDGILFSENHGVVISGEMTDELPTGAKVQTFSRRWDPWFYLHVRESTKELPSSSSAPQEQQRAGRGTFTDYVPLAEYLFRYDRGGFWVGEAAFDYFRPVPFTRFFRWFLDDFLHTRMLYRALYVSDESARFFVQDLGVPYENAERFIDYVSENLRIWPLWLCPLKTPPGPTFHPHQRKSIGDWGRNADSGEGELLNIGVWGWGPKDRADFVEVNRDLERRVNELGGMKWLYAHTYYDEDEFWEAYGDGKAGEHRRKYEVLRQKYKATSLPTVHDKVKVDAVATARNPWELGWKAWLKSRWPVGGLYGIWKGIRSKEYLLHRHATWKWRRGEESKEKDKLA